MPVNDRSKMTAESASTQGKDSTPALQKAWVPPHPQRMARKGQISLLSKAWVPPHPRCTLHKGHVSLLCKAWVPPHPRCTLHKGHVSLLCKAWVPPHPRHMACKSSTVRVWVCSHPRHTEGFIQLCCLFTLMFIHPNTPIVVSTGINPSLTKS